MQSHYERVQRSAKTQYEVQEDGTKWVGRPSKRRTRQNSLDWIGL